MNTRSRSQRPMLKEQLLITPWPDPTIDTLGFDVRDRDTPPGDVPYVETFWLPILGPTATWLLRRANSHLDSAYSGRMPSSLLSQSLGLGPSTSRSSKLADTIDRVERFGFAFLTYRGDELRVRTHLPPVPERDIKRLPAPLRELHRQLQPSDVSRRRSKASELTPPSEGLRRASLFTTAPAAIRIARGAER